MGEQAPQTQPNELIDSVPNQHGPQPFAAPEAGARVENPEGLPQNPNTHVVVQGEELPRLDLIDNVPGQLGQSGPSHREVPVESVTPRDAPITVSEPGDPGHDERVANWQAGQDMMRAAAAAVSNEDKTK